MRDRLPKDVQLFIEGYHDQDDDPDANDNLRFYNNELHCQPDNLLIDDLHMKWKGDYSTLEWNHGFIQWLFPIREHGLNFEAQPLQVHEIESMKDSSEVIDRLYTSYEIMLDFYGMRLEDRSTGLLRRSSNFSSRYRNLVKSSHNYLRISRIVKCLSELGLGHLHAGLMLHVLNEQSEHDELNVERLKDSMDRWWIGCNRDSEEREWLFNLVQRIRTTTFILKRSDVEDALNNRREKGNLSFGNDKLEDIVPLESISDNPSPRKIPILAKMAQHTLSHFFNRGAAGDV